MTFRLIDTEPGKQQYTLKCTDIKTKQSTLVTYNDSPVLTTYHEDLVEYTRRLVAHFGEAKIYTICMVTEMELAELYTHA